MAKMRQADQCALERAPQDKPFAGKHPSGTKHLLTHPGRHAKRRTRWLPATAVKHQSHYSPYDEKSHKLSLGARVHWIAPFSRSVVHGFQVIQNVVTLKVVALETSGHCCVPFVDGIPVFLRP